MAFNDYRVMRLCCVFYLIVGAWATVDVRADTEISSNWIGSSGDWTDVTKWSTNPNYPNNGTPAGTSYSAVINAAGSSYTVTLSSNVTIDSLLLDSSSATFLQTANTLSVGTLFGIESGVYQLNAGTLTVPMLNVADTATAFLNGGTFKNVRIVGNANAIVRCSYGTLDNVTLAGAASTNIAPTGSIKDVNFRNGLTLLNNNIHMNAGANLLGTDASMLGGTGQIIVDAPSGSNMTSTIGGSATTIGQNITVRTGDSPNNFANYVVVNTVLNQGTISAESSLDVTVTDGNSPWTNAGTLRVSKKSLTVSGTWTNNGAISATGGTLNLSGSWGNNGSITASNAAIRLGGIGSGFSGISTNNSNLDIVGQYTTSQIRQISKTATSLGIADYNNAILDNSNDTVTLSGANGDFRLAGGKILGGTITTTDNHKMVSSTSTSILDGVCLQAPLSGTGGRIQAINLDNRSTMTFNGGGLSLSGPWSNTGSISVANGYLSLYGTPTVMGSITVSKSKCDVWTNLMAAQIRSIATSSASWSLNNGAALDNSGDTLTLSQNGNKWAFYGGSITGGTIQSTDGTPLIISRSISYLFTSLIVDGVTLAANTEISGGVRPTVRNGLTLANNSTITLGVSPSGNGNLEFSGTQALNGTGTILINGYYDDLASIFSSAGTLTVGPNIVIRNGTNGGMVGAGIGATMVNQGLVSSQTGSKTVTINGSFTNQGIVEARNGGNLLFNKAPSNLNGTQLTGGSWRAFANSTVRMVGADIRTNAAEIVLDGSSANFYNAVSGTTSALANLATNANGGQFTIRNGRNFTTVDALLNSGTITVGSGTTLNTPGGLTNISAGILAGTGTIHANVSNSGSIAPTGDSLPTGLLTIQGNLTQQPTGQFQMDISGVAPGSQYDKLNVVGLLHFDGALHIALSNGFSPQLGSTFDLFDFSASDGQFSSLDLPALSDNLCWEASMLYTTGVVTVVPEPATLILLATCLLSLLTFAWQRRK